MKKIVKYETNYKMLCDTKEEAIYNEFINAIFKELVLSTTNVEIQTIITKLMNHKFRYNSNNLDTIKAYVTVIENLSCIE